MFSPCQQERKSRFRAEHALPEASRCRRNVEDFVCTLSLGLLGLLIRAFVFSSLSLWAHRERAYAGHIRWKACGLSPPLLFIPLKPPIRRGQLFKSCLLLRPCSEGISSGVKVDDDCVGTSLSVRLFSKRCSGPLKISARAQNSIASRLKDLLAEQVKLGLT